MKKILIGITCHDKKKYIIDEFISMLRDFTYEGADIVFVDNSKTENYADYIRNEGFHVIRSKWYETTQERLTSAYNFLRDEFLQGNYTHLMIIEQDIFPPKDVIERLLNHEKEVCSGLYWLDVKPCVMVGDSVKVKPKDKEKYMYQDRIFKYDFIDQDKLNTEDILNVFACGLGCVLITRKVLLEVPFRVQRGVDGRWAGHNDMYFYFDLREKGIEVWLDPTIKCEHKSDIYGNTTPP